MLRHAMQYLLKSNVSIGMIGLLFKLPFYIFRKHFRCFKDVYIPVPRRLLKDLALIYAERFYPNLCYKSLRYNLLLWHCIFKKHSKY